MSSEFIDKIMKVNEEDDLISSVQGRVEIQLQYPHFTFFFVEHIRQEIQKIKESGGDVSYIEQKLPELMKNEIMADAENKVNKQLSYPRYTIFSVERIQKSIDKAKEAGCDVSQLECQIPILKRNELITDAENKVNKQLGFPRYTIFSVEMIQKSINKAKEAGCDVSKLECQIPILMRNELITIAEHQVMTQLSYPRVPIFSVKRIQDAIRKAKEAGYNVSHLEKKLPRLIKNESIINEEKRKEIQETRSFLSQFPEVRANTRISLQKTKKKIK